LAAWIFIIAVVDWQKILILHSQIAMPFTKPRQEVLDRIANEVMAALRKDHANPLENPHGMTFMDIERTANAIGKYVASRLTEQSLATHAADQPQQAPCPNCSRLCRLTRKKRTITTEDGDISYQEPAAHCVECRRDFFPDTPGIEDRRTAV